MPDLSDLARVELHARTLFIHDAAGRLVEINEPKARPAPRFFLAWTRAALIWRARHDLPAALVDHLSGLVAASAAPAELRQEPSCVAAIRAALAPIEDEDLGPEYCFPASYTAPAGAQVIAVTADNADVLARWLPEWIPDTRYPFPITAVIVDGHAVSICACVRLPTPATQAGVETHPAFRGHGYAAIATAAWARAVLELGYIPLYGTSWTNVASQHVAGKLGLRCYAAAISIA